jgi:hypothetical protein
LKPDPDVICRGLGDSAVLLHLTTNEIFELNATGYRIWQMLGEGLGREEMRSRLMREFNVAREQVEGELDELLAQLSARQLVVEG